MTREAAREEKPLTFKLAGKKMNLTSVEIAAVILISLALVYAVLRVIRFKKAKKR